MPSLTSGEMEVDAIRRSGVLLFFLSSCLLLHLRERSTPSLTLRCKTDFVVVRVFLHSWGLAWRCERHGRRI